MRRNRDVGAEILRLRYLVRWGWLDLLSSIPAVDVLRWGRAARILRIVRVIRGVKATKLLSEFVLARRAQSAFLAASLIAILLVVFSSAAILQFETSAEANIRTPEDAIWWAVVTITTVGYGDRYPVSPEGRIIAALLMTAGVGLFGTFSGFIAAWFLGGSRQESGRSRKRGEVGREVRESRAPEGARARGAAAGAEVLTVHLVDGRALVVPLAWFPRLVHATPAERANIEILGDGALLHWPELGEDLSVAGLLAGREENGGGVA